MFSFDGKRLAGIATDGKVTVWETATGDVIDSFTAPSRYMRRLFFAADGELRGLVSVADKFKIWKAAPPQFERNMLKSAPVVGIAFSPNGDRLAVMTESEGAVVWDLATANIIARLGGAWKRNSLLGTTDGSIAFSPDGKFVAFPAKGNKVTMWDLADGRLRFELSGHTQPVRTVAFSPRGDLLASGGEDGVVQTWLVENGEPMNNARIDRQSIHEVAFHSSGGWLVASTWGSGVQSFDARTGQYLGIQQPYLEPTVEFSPDGRHLAHAEREIEIWNVPESGRFTMSYNMLGKYRHHHTEVSLMMKGHADKITAVVYSADGKRLFTGDESGTIKVWETKDGEETFAIPGDNNGVTSMAVSGERLAVAYRDGTVRIFDGTPLASP